MPRSRPGSAGPKWPSGRSDPRSGSARHGTGAARRPPLGERVIGPQRLTDGVTRPVYEDERGQYTVEDGERINGVWLPPEAEEADVPLVREANLQTPGN
jgi:hypothetical protein